MKPEYIRIFIALLLPLMACLQAPASEASTRAVASKATETKSTELALTLAALMGDEAQGGALHLSYDHDRKRFILPLSSRLQTRALRLHLVFANSVSLSHERSQLRIRFNGLVAGQVQLDPAYPSGAIDLTIDGHHLHEGDNIVQFETSLSAPGQDSAVPSSELWVEIDSAASTLTLVADRQPVVLQLSGLRNLVSASRWQGSAYPLGLALVSDTPSDALLDAASFAVQGIALLAGEMPLQVHNAAAPLPDRDTLLIGTFAALNDLLGEGGD